jgi:hypothetical protein
VILEPVPGRRGHLATALLLRDVIDSLVTYDDRPAAAATAHGLTVEMPGHG